MVGFAIFAASVGFASSVDARPAKRRAPVYAPPSASIVVDAKTDRTLYAADADALRHPASITKVMTLYLLFEQLDNGRFKLDTSLRISAHAAAQPPSKLGLDAGDKISVENAIKALVTKSANDIAAAVAENIANSEEAFADMMTRKARALGMTRTVYRNASGLPDEKQVTTARDLSILARAIQDRFPRYYPYFSTPSFIYAGRSMRNHNKLLGRIEGVDGIKTGYTRMSGFNLMTSAKSDGRHIVAVVLGGRSGAARDRAMASLIGTHLPRAYAGQRTAPMVAEAPTSSRIAAALIAKPRFPIDFSRPRVLADKGGTDEGDDGDDVPAPAAKPAPPPAAAVRPVVASASGSMSTTTPSAFRWITGPQPVVRSENRPAEQIAEPIKPAAHAAERKPVEARALDPKPFQDRVPETVVAKAEPRHEPRAEEKIDPRPTGSTGWTIQLGAPEDEGKARELLAQAKATSQILSKAMPFTEKIVKDGTTLWRARFSGFDPDGAQAACKALKRSGFNCFATKG